MASGYPGGGYPQQPSQFGGPPGGQQYPGYPPQGQQQYPGHPQTPGAGGYPQAPGAGGYPQAPGAGGYPQTPAPSGYPPAGGAGGYPPAGGAGGYPGGPSAFPAGPPSAVSGPGGPGKPAAGAPMWMSQMAAQQPAAPGVDETVRQWFLSVDRDRSGTISEEELGLFQGPGMERPLGQVLALKMIRIFDKDRTSSIELTEFVLVHRFLGAMWQSFATADKDRSRALDPREIHEALASAGFTMLQPHAVQALFRKYDVFRRGQIDFNAFLGMAADIALIRTKFEAVARGQQYIPATLDTLLQLVSDI